MKSELTQKEVVIPTACGYGCGGRCLIKAHVKDGVVTRVETDDGGEPQLRACARGRAHRQRLNSPDRLMYPMKRVGPRGAGQFQRISWNEALDTVAGELKRIKEQYGSSAIYPHSLGASIGAVHGRYAFLRLLNLFGGCTLRWSGPSAEGSVFASRTTYGSLETGNSRDDLRNSRLVLMWGWNPANTIFTPGTTLALLKAKEAGTKIITVDPRYTESSATLANQWIPIKPGTDAAMLIAMAYVIIKESLQDQKFIDTYVTGFEKYRDYVLGTEDGIARTPAWAEPITGVPAATIEKLAKEYATLKPAALFANFAPGRTAYGEQYHRAAQALVAITGNLGVHGGHAAGFERMPYMSMFGAHVPIGENPTEHGAWVGGGLDTEGRNKIRLPFEKLWDIILKGKAGGYPWDIKMMWVTYSNPLNQLPDINKGVAAMNKLEFILVHDQFMTPTARFADILLPVKDIWERDDLRYPWFTGEYYLFSNKVVTPQADIKTDIEICAELASRLGIKGYGDRTDEEWIKEILKRDKGLEKEIGDYDEFKREGVRKIKVTEPIIAFKKQIEEPKNNPFSTPSGKIEIYSQQLAELAHPGIPPIPKYIETWESIHDPLAAKYPLQLITIHPKFRTHSNYANISPLNKIEPNYVWINSVDAQNRGIKNEDMVSVFNDRGRMVATAKVTERIIPGVVSIEEGAWYAPDVNGIDRGGNPNVLVGDSYSPGGAFPSNTCLVQLARFSEK